MSGVNEIITRSDFKSQREPMSSEVTKVKTKQVVERIGGTGRLTSLYQLAMVWKNRQEVWPFVYGIPTLALPSMVSSFLILRHFRTSLVLGEYARLASYAVTLVIPAMSSIGFHINMVDKMTRVSDKAEEKHRILPTCRMCDQMWLGGTQVITTVGYPIFLSIFTSFPTLTAVQNYNLPNIRRNPMKVAKYAFDILKDMKGQLGFLVLLNFFFAAGLGHFEKNCVEDVLMPNIDSFLSGKYNLKIDKEKESSFFDYFK